MTIPELYNLYLKNRKVQIDSRKIVEGDLFFALRGNNFDANIFAKEAIKKGAIGAIVDDPLLEDFSNHIYYFKDSLSALQGLAKYHRDQLSIPIIGLTGSNGKTTTKELMASVLSEKYKVLYTQGNLNNHIGVPLTILSILPDHEIGIIEMGANHLKEIEFLSSISQPTFAYITNFGKAHLEGFGGYEGVIKGKSELYDWVRKNGGLVIVNYEDSIQLELTKDLSRVIFNDRQKYSYQLLENENHTISIKNNNQEIINSQLTGNYNFTNICAAIVLGEINRLTFNQIKLGIEKYKPSNFRSQIEVKGNLTLILDTYNANPSSMEVSIKNFSQFEGVKTAIIGDMFELGEESKKEHQKIVELLVSSSIDRIFLVGKNFNNTMAVDSRINKIEDTEGMIEYLIKYPIKEGNLLLKASRGMALERLLDHI